MPTEPIQPWLFQVDPYEGESLSHFLGRLRRLNHLSPNGLGKLAGIGAVVSRWERFHLNPFPTPKELEAVAAVAGLEVGRLAQMLPPQGVGMQWTPIRLCGACYAVNPCHQIKWQYKSTGACDRHKLRLLSKCPNCEAKFAIPANWEEGICKRCFTTFTKMAHQQTPLSRGDVNSAPLLNEKT
jgi:hypothetical protein